MIFLRNYLNNIFEMIKKHKFQSLLMVLFVFISLWILGFTINMQQIADKASTAYDETYGEKTFFYTGEGISDNIYYRYLDEDNDKDFYHLLSFKNRLNNCDSFIYTEIMSQPLEIINSTIPDIFLLNYESGDWDYSVYEYDGDTIYAAKSIQVSESFFMEFNIEVLDGNTFSEEDYLFDKNKEIPVLVGIAYKEYFDIGDKFEGYYIFEKRTFVVNGFTKEQSFFYSRNKDDFISLERYVILPSLKVDVAEEFSKILLLQQMTGIISSSLGYEKTLEIYNEYLKESGIDEWNLYIVNPDHEAFSMIGTYSAMTNEVARQFNIMAAIVLVFGCMAVIVVVCGMLKENHYSFGVSLLCGASFKYIVFEIIGLVGFILLLGDLFSSLIMLTQYYKPISFLVVQAAITIITVISCTVCVLYLKQMDISDIIGGKE